jgi:hypothetical protein
MAGSERPRALARRDRVHQAWAPMRIERVLSWMLTSIRGAAHTLRVAGHPKTSPISDEAPATRALPEMDISSFSRGGAKQLAPPGTTEPADRCSLARAVFNAGSNKQDPERWCAKALDRTKHKTRYRRTTRPCEGIYPAIGTPFLSPSYIAGLQLPQRTGAYDAHRSLRPG